MAPLLGLALLGLGACGGTSLPPTPAPPSDEAIVRDGIDRVLELQEIENVLGARARAFTRQVAIMLRDPTDEELERLVPAVIDGFAYDSLYGDVAANMRAEADPETVSALLDWMEAGATAAVRRIADEYEPPLTLEEYTQEFTDEPPSEQRIHLMAEWSAAQGHGDFFVLIQEALREAAVRVHAAMREDVSPFVPLSTEELEVARQNSRGASVITLLHRYETVPEPLIRRSIAEYRTESGQWFARTYPWAVAEAIRAAGIRVAERLDAGADSR